MNIKSIFNGIRKYCFALNKLSEETNASKWYLYTDCLWSWLRYGCVLNHYTEGGYYLRKRFEKKNIVTYRRWKKILKYNNKNYEHFLGNKLDFCKHFHDYIGREYLSSKEMTMEEFLSFLKRYGRVFVKPVDGLEGKGVTAISFGTDEQNEQHFRELKESDYIIEEPVVQHRDMVFGNKSVNTIRAYTTYDKKLNKAFCIATTLRAGVGNSIIDNSHAGGLSYEIDLDTGVIDSRGWGHQNAGGMYHPNTEICMLGRKIPYWKEVIELCQNAASLIPEVAYIGWDVAITEKGPILIEGNHDPDIDVMEFVGKFGYYNIIMSHLR
jgi:hypothetical protein